MPEGSNEYRGNDYRSLAADELDRAFSLGPGLGTPTQGHNRLWEIAAPVSLGVGGWGARSGPGSLERELPRCYSRHDFNKVNYLLIKRGYG